MKHLLVLLVLVYAAVASRTPLDEYVKRPTPHYEYFLLATIPREKSIVYMVNMTSVKWLNDNELANNTIWFHYLTITVPRTLQHNDVGFLFISGGSNSFASPNPDPISVDLAESTGTVAVVVRQISNQPLYFKEVVNGTPIVRRRSEDSIMAYAWRRFLESNGRESDWVPRLPMVKASMLAMTTTKRFVRTQHGFNIKKWVVAGASKRGWTAWLTAAADKRVIAVIPMVIDILNMAKNFQHIFPTFCLWPPALNDYVGEDIISWFDTAQFKKLEKIIDPLSYNNRYKLMPKLIISSTGDQFFAPDSSLFGYSKLKGPKHIRYIPNSEHSLGGTDVFITVQTFYKSVLDKTARPQFDWKLKTLNATSALISVDIKPFPIQPTKVSLWQAVNPNAKDFRVEAIGRVYQQSVLTATQTKPNGELVFHVNVQVPAQGFTAFLVELEYGTFSTGPLKLTTNTYILPDTLPCAGRPLGV